LHGLMDCAVETADYFRAQLSDRIDVDTAIELLTRRPPHARNTADVTECLRMIAALRSLNQQLHSLHQQMAARISEETRALESELAVARSLESELAVARAKAVPNVSGLELLKELGRRIRRRITG
jgi:hypothetical protein